MQLLPIETTQGMSILLGRFPPAAASVCWQLMIPSVVEASLGACIEDLTRACWETLSRSWSATLFFFKIHADLEYSRSWTRIHYTCNRPPWE